MEDDGLGIKGKTELVFGAEAEEGEGEEKPETKEEEREEGKEEESERGETTEEETDADVAEESLSRQGEFDTATQSDRINLPRVPFHPRGRDVPSNYSVFLQVMLSVTVFSLCLWWSVPFIIICYGEVAEKWAPENPKKIPIVIIGGYGDLAKKYLWQGVNNLDESYGGLPKSPLLLYSSGRAPPEVGVQKTLSTLDSGVFCASGDAVCAERKEAFVRRVAYRQLKTEQHFEDLCAEITLHSAGDEEGRIFYLSVPPFTYPDIVKYIDLHCRPPRPPPPADGSPSPPPPWLRVVVEKPFGNDFQSAQALSQSLLEHLKDEELYRIDHYLGKTTVRNILPFRLMNRETGIERLLNREHVDKVEVVVKETDGCKGRMNYYDEYGVVADMLQNHLTEVALMVAMDLPTDSQDLDEIEELKLAALASLRPLDATSTVLGQYSSYNLEATQELSSSTSSSSSSSSSSDVSSPQRRISHTPTFAATALHFDNLRWKGVPFILMTGKKLDERNNYLRVSFKDNIFCVPANDDDDPVENHPCRRRQLIFHISHGLLKRPSILTSKSLPRPLPVPGWREQRTQGANLVFGATKAAAFHVSSAVEDEIAYSFLIRAVVKGQRHFFLSDDHLMASWRVWSPLMEALRDVKPKSYSHHKNQLQNLQYLYENKGTLRFVHHSEGGNHEYAKYSKNANQLLTFINASLVLGSSSEVTSSLASRVRTMALRRLASSATSGASAAAFHLALPGGNSARPLLRHLVAMEGFPWSKTHVWMVDERLADFSSRHSNFGGVVEIIKAASIPYFNLHPIPVGLHPGLEAKDIADIYGRELKSLVADLRFDCVILGLGADGHVASLFPHDVVDDNNNNNNGNSAPVELSEASPSSQLNLKTDVIVSFKNDDENVNNDDGGPPNCRISMNYGLLNRAENVFVIAMGESKRSIVGELKKAEGAKDRTLLPVDILDKSKTTFFIDDVAWGGD